MITHKFKYYGVQCIDEDGRHWNTIAEFKEHSDAQRTAEFLMKKKKWPHRALDTPTINTVVIYESPDEYLMK